jgi:heme O synthase-like polyprenyltransferase
MKLSESRSALCRRSRSMRRNTSITAEASNEGSGKNSPSAEKAPSDTSPWHFWLLLFSLRSDYEQSGLPSPTQQLSARQFANLTFIWMLSAFASSLLLPLYGLIRSPLSALGLLACSLWFARESAKLIRQNPENAVFQSSFRSINLFALFVMALLALDALLA